MNTVCRVCYHLNNYNLEDILNGNIPCKKCGRDIKIKTTKEAERILDISTKISKNDDLTSDQIEFPEPGMV